MIEIISFDLEGNFGAFRDPSVNTNQTTYYIPSKTHLVGLLGAILGIERGHYTTELYSKEFLKLLEDTIIGIKTLNFPDKIPFGINFRSLKKTPVTKPTKSEVLVNPKYRIFVQSSNEVMNKLKSALPDNTFLYTPFLGHAYCPAKISNFNVFQGEDKGYYELEVDSVVLDEITETSDRSSFSSFKIESSIEKYERVLVERHLHNFVKEGKLQKKVLKHWIPYDCKISFEDEYQKELNLVKFFELQKTKSYEKRIICMY